MLEQEITFDQLPHAVSTILEDVRELKNICRTIMEGTNDNEIWFTVKDLIDYLPEHPSEPTIYRWKREGTIPYYKNDVTRSLKFKKSEIDQWLENGRRLTIAEQNAIHDAEILARRHAKKGACYD